jgi:hypothetical protein
VLPLTRNKSFLLFVLVAIQRTNNAPTCLPPPASSRSTTPQWTRIPPHCQHRSLLLFVVALMYYVGTFESKYDVKLSFQLKKLPDWLPMRYSGMHLCHNHPMVRALAPSSSSSSDGISEYRFEYTTVSCLFVDITIPCCME